MTTEASGSQVDLSAVRIHTGATADASAKAVGARAYTVGRHIVFRQGEFRPDTRRGRALLAHELEHVAQQGAAPYRGGSIRMGSPHDPEERAAARAEAHGPGETRVAEATTLRRTGDGPVHAIRMSCADQVIVFDTPTGSHTYHLTDCTVPTGTYSAGVTTTATSFELDFGAAASSDEEFSFGFDIQAGQANPATMLADQSTVPVQVVDHIPHHAVPTGSLQTRLDRFKELVRQAGLVRMEQNIQALDQWSVFLQFEMDPYQVQAQTHGTEVQRVLTRAAQTREQALADRWLVTPGPNRRWVIEQQIDGRFHACTGCHATLRADDMDMDMRLAGIPQPTPIEQLRLGSEHPALPPAFAAEFGGMPAVDAGMYPNIAEANDLLERIRPFLSVLGPSGYRVLPRESLGSTASPEDLLADILARIRSRQDDFRAFMARIREPGFDYLELRPIVRDLLPATDADVRAAVEDEISTAQAWEVVESIVVGAATIGLLLLIIFPPTSALGAAGAVALGGALSAHQIYSGYQDYQRGSLYALGQGAHDVIDPAQQQAADLLMASGVLNMVVGSVGLASAGLSSIRIVRGPPTAPGQLGPVTAVEGRSGGTLYEVTGWGRANPNVRVTSPTGQVLHNGSLASYRAGLPARAAAPATGSAPAGSGLVYPTQGGAALAAQPAPVPVAPPVPATAPAPTVTPAAPNITGPLGVMAGAGLVDSLTTVASGGTGTQPVMPAGLSAADQRLWDDCLDMYDVYKATQAEAAAFSTRIHPIQQRIAANTATPQDIVDLCLLLDERIDVVRRLHRERLDYIEAGCDKFDWFNRGRTRAQREAAHRGELDAVGRQLTNLYELRKQLNCL